MPLKLVPVLGSVGVGAIDVAEEHFEIDPTYKHVTRGALFAVGLGLSLATKEDTILNDLGEGLVLSEIPLLEHTIYDLTMGGEAGGKMSPTKEQIELRLKGRRGFTGRVRYV